MKNIILALLLALVVSLSGCVDDGTIEKMGKSISENTVVCNEPYMRLGSGCCLDKLRVNRDFILNAIQLEGVGTGVHYQAIHTHPYYYEKLGPAENFPNAQWISDRTMSIPLSSKLSDYDVDTVIEAVTKVLNSCKR